MSGITLGHDDVIKWKHFLRYWPFVRGIHQSLVNSPHKGQWGGALMFSLICAWINGWVNNRDAVDLRHHSAHYDVTNEYRNFCHGSAVIEAFHWFFFVMIRYQISGVVITGKPGCYCLCQENFNSSPPGQNGCHFADDVFRCIFVNEKFGILIKISLKFVPKGPIHNNQASV